jgi:DNA-binding MarR family transcriptional regulator
MEKIYTLQNNLTGDPIKIEITFLDQEDSRAIQLRSNVRLSQESPGVTAALKRPDREILVRLEQIRNWERRNFPQWNSQITHDIFRLLGAGHPKGDAYTIKQVVHATGCSERALRNQIKRFEEHGWVTRAKSVTDKRNSHVYPTPALKEAYQQWLQLHQSRPARADKP